MRLPTSILIAIHLLAAPAHAQDDDENAIDDSPRITVVGSASAEVAPDLAIITLGVASHKATAVSASDAVAAAAKATVDAAKAQGIADSDIATKSIDLNRTFDQIRDASGHYIGQKPSGFDASNTLQIRVRDLAKTGPIVQDLIEKGASSFDGIAFDVEHPQPILDRLAGEAVTNARRQAQIIAQAAGVRLGHILLIERAQPAATPPVRFAPRLRSEASALKEMPVQAGTTSFSADMKVTWSIDR